MIRLRILLICYSLTKCSVDIQISKIHTFPYTIRNFPPAWLINEKWNCLSIYTGTVVTINKYKLVKTQEETIRYLKYVAHPIVDKTIIILDSRTCHKSMTSAGRKQFAANFMPNNEVYCWLTVGRRRPNPDRLVSKQWINLFSLFIPQLIVQLLPGEFKHFNYLLQIPFLSCSLVTSISIWTWIADFCCFRAFGTVSTKGLNVDKKK